MLLRRLLHRFGSAQPPADGAASPNHTPEVSTAPSAVAQPAPPIDGLIPEPSTARLSKLVARYPDAVGEFYAYLREDLRPIFIDDANYHRRRYLAMLDREYGHRILEVGSDKPFITHCLRELNPSATVSTISVDLPFSPFPVLYVDIESEEFPLAAGSVDDVIFTEVIEHLFRDPAWCLFQINRVLREGGRLYLTTPNACGYDAIQNALRQKNPNERAQYFARMESGHPHLWTVPDLTLLLEAHGFAVRELSTANFYEIPCDPRIGAFIQATGSQPEMQRQAIVVVAEKTTAVSAPSYPLPIFPDGMPAQFIGAVGLWATSSGRPPPMTWW